MCNGYGEEVDAGRLILLHQLEDNTVQLSISLFSQCRASCYPAGTLSANKSGNPPNALASLRLCGSLRQAAPRLRKKIDFDKEF
ncbi:hypothetical protein [Nostoc sp. C110]|uniref:hypothetical protein n=1 Tax=Nostoc sp. C110 TaxID=3349876 RepID=UPI00370D70FC